MNDFRSRSKEACGKSDNAGSSSAAKKAAEERGWQSEISKKGFDSGHGDIDLKAVQCSDVQELSAVKNRDAAVLALIHELIAIVDGAGRRGRCPSDVDSVAVQQGDVQKLRAIADGNATVIALVYELISIDGS